MARSALTTEHHEHIALIDWVNLQPSIRDIFIHIPNERRCTPREGWILKRKGVKAGVSDFLLPMPNKAETHHGLWLELKSVKGSLTEMQYRWLILMRDQNYKAEVAHGFEEAKNIILEYIS